MLRMMPYDKVGVTLDELVPNFYRTYDALAKKLKRSENKPWGLKRLAVGGNGRELLVDFDSLPNDIQEVLSDPRKLKGNILKNYFAWDEGAKRFYSDYARPVFGYLSESEQGQYIINASVMQAVLLLEEARTNERINKKASIHRWKDIRTGESMSLAKSLWMDAMSFNDTLWVEHRLKHNLPTNERRFKEAYNNFKSDSYYSIIKDPEGKALMNAVKVNDAVEEILKGMHIKKHNPSATEIYNNYRAFREGLAVIYSSKTGEMFDPSNYPDLSEGTIRAYLAKYASKVGTSVIRTGDRQRIINKLIPAAQMELPKFANSIISVDDRQPPFWYEKGKRMWFYIGLDVASQAITAVVYGKTKEGIILDFYRQMVRFYAYFCNGNMPIELEAEKSGNSQYESTFLEEGSLFKYTHIEANNARAKYIERMFGKLRYEEEKGEDGWIARPHAKSENNIASYSKYKEREIIPYHQLVQARLKNLEDWNNKPHPTEANMTRWEYFLERQIEEKNPINYKRILPMLGYREESSCRQGTVALQYAKRAIAQDGKICTGEDLLSAMRKIEGKEIEVYWLDAYDGGVLKAMVYQGSKYICELMEFPKYNRAKAERTDADIVAESLQSAYKNTVIGYINRESKSVRRDIEVEFTAEGAKPKVEFRMAGLKRYEAKEGDVKVLGEVHEDDQEWMEAKGAGSARSFMDNFLK